MWLNWYLCQWDLFLETLIDNKNKEYQNFNSNNFLYFKKINQNSYIYYRHATQILDAILTDYYHLSFDKRHLIATIIFIIFCKFHEISIFNDKLISINFDFNEEFYLDLFNKNEYNFIFKNIFWEFLDQSFNFQFEDIVPSCVYCSKFLSYDFNYEYPLIIKARSEKLENVNFYFKFYLI